MEQIIPAVILAADAVCDLRKKEIFPIATAAGAILGIAVNLFLYGRGLTQTLLSLIPGLLLLAISAVSRGRIGAGDALSFFLVGSWIREAVWRVLLLSLFGAAAFAAALWIRKKKNAEFPFVPFLLAAFAVEIIANTIRAG